MQLNSRPKCTFARFTIAETEMYISKKGLQLNSSLVNNLTYSNPLLMSSIPYAQDEHRIRGHIKNWVVTYIRNILITLVELNALKSWLEGELEVTTKWLYYVENEVNLSQKEISDFLTSWIHIQGICILEEGGDLINCNFPGVAKLLVNELAVMRRDEKVPSNPIVNGFIFEENFFTEIGKMKTLHVITKEMPIITLHFAVVETLQTGEVLKNMTSGVLYHLRYKHPVIDGVGIMERGKTKKKWLVMIQVSLSSYKSHRSKISDIAKYLPCPELKHSSHGWVVELCDMNFFLCPMSWEFMS